MEKLFISLVNKRRLSFNCFLNLTNDRVISADQIMNKAKGPVWYKKQKDKGIVHKKWRVLDKEANWDKSNAAGWVYAHGSLTIFPESNDH